MARMENTNQNHATSYVTCEHCGKKGHSKEHCSKLRNATDVEKWATLANFVKVVKEKATMVQVSYHQTHRSTIWK